MNKNRWKHSALVIIDMENGFVDPESPFCIKGAAAAVPHIAGAAAAARKAGLPVFFVRRVYREDGSDVEKTRLKKWKEAGRPMTASSTGALSAEFVDGLRPEPGDYIINKPRWSAFFGTELDVVLRRLGAGRVVLAGTTTPNCVRSSCYDANSLDYDVTVLSDGTSSNTEEIQRVNLEDMGRMGADIMTCAEFADEVSRV